MPDVTSNLSDIGLGHLLGLNAVVEFHLNAPQVSSARVYSTRPLSVVPAVNGDFTATLARTDVMLGDAFYTMHVRWNEPGTPAIGGYSPVDVHFDIPIRVGVNGGILGDLIGGATNLSLVYVSLTPPRIGIPWSMWLEQNPDDLDDPRNTSILYRSEPE